MTVVTGTKPHPIFLAGRWVESPDVLVVDNPADPETPAGTRQRVEVLTTLSGEKAKT